MPLGHALVVFLEGVLAFPRILIVHVIVLLYFGVLIPIFDIGSLAGVTSGFVSVVEGATVRCVAWGPLGEALLEGIVWWRISFPRLVPPWPLPIRYCCI